MKIIFLGIQGSGKSTQAKILAKTLNLPLIEMGQIFRNLAANDPAIKQSIDKGHLVADDVVVKTYQERISKEDCKNGYVLDGYPRNPEQLKGLEEDFDKVFYVKVSDQEGKKRLIKRARHDDTEEAIEKRIEIFHQETEPLLEHFRNKGILEEINGERSIEEIAQDIEKRVKK